jgi:hypothetical protein
VVAWAGSGLWIACVDWLLVDPLVLDRECQALPQLPVRPLLARYLTALCVLKAHHHPSCQPVASRSS